MDCVAEVGYRHSVSRTQIGVAVVLPERHGDPEFILFYVVSFIWIGPNLPLYFKNPPASFLMGETPTYRHSPVRVE